jgi:hypothetical protein
MEEGRKSTSRTSMTPNAPRKHMKQRHTAETPTRIWREPRRRRVTERPKREATIQRKAS